MLRAALIIARKDLRLLAGRSGGLMQALLLGLLLIFMFSLSLVPGQGMTAQGAAAVFWMSSAFCQVLIFNMLHALEEENGQILGLLLAPAPLQSIWLGKAMAGACMLFISQLVFLPAIIIFLNQQVSSLWPVGVAALVIIDAGIVAVGSLLGALARGHSAKESLFSIIIFPLLSPLFLGGIRVGAAVFSGAQADESLKWLSISLAFDAIFTAAALLLFPFAYNVDE
ncbi:MAG: heme exporter protein CcmB [Desulfovibrio sp.]|jgi:heme exporter protein B|nr:heme exporter protein CcmB [Desulfovibrio sp.]